MDKDQCRARLDIRPAPREAVLVYVANYHPDEDFLLRSLAEAKKRLAAEAAHAGTRPAPGFRVHFVGPNFTEGKLKEFGIYEFAHEEGRRPFSEMATWLGAADLLLLPYPNTVFNRSRWPNKIGDYLAAARPTLTNRTGDFRPLFERFDIGVASEGTPEAYGRAIADAVAAEGRQQWDRWGMTARRVAEGPLSWRLLARRLADFWIE
jgi:glycosyltransferase involved in cell wall biosynthesis